jgi:hypothetical protein
MAYIQLVALARGSFQPLLKRKQRAELWQRLNRRFPSSLATILMPNHLHLVLDCLSPEEAREIFIIELRAFSRKHFPGRKIWVPIEPPQIIPDKLHLRRTIRYVLLNACRANLAADPLEWEWSTYRDVFGAASPSWVDKVALRRIFGWNAAEFDTRFHQYVSGDPSVSVAGTPPPVSPRASLIIAPKDAIRCVLAASRTLEITRRKGLNIKKVVTALMRKAGGSVPKESAGVLEIAPRTLRHLAGSELTKAEVQILDAAWRVAADPRFLSRFSST